MDDNLYKHQQNEKEETIMIFQKKEKYFVKLIALISSISICFGCLGAYAETPEHEPPLEEPSVVLPEETEATGAVTSDFNTEGGITPFYLPSDKYEPNDIWSKAKTIPLDSKNSEIYGNFSKLSDNDWFKFTPTSSCDITISVTNLVVVASLSIFTEESMQDTVPSPVASATSVNGKVSLSTIIHPNKTYYLLLSGDASEDDTTGYTMQLSYYYADKYEPNDTYEDATFWNELGSDVSSIAQGTLHKKLDVDRFQINPQYNGFANFTFSSPPGGHKYIMYVLKETNSGPPQTISSLINYPVKKGETYYIQVAGNSSPDEFAEYDIYTATYTLDVPKEDWYDNGINIPIDPLNFDAPYVDLENALVNASDYRMYSMDIEKDGNIFLSLNNVPKGCNYSFDVYNENTKELLHSNDGSIDLTVKAGEKYGIKIKSTDGTFNADQNFQLYARWDIFDEYEPNNTTEIATDLSDQLKNNMSYQVNANIHDSKNDLDYYKINLDQDCTLSFNVKNTIISKGVCRAAGWNEEESEPTGFDSFVSNFTMDIQKNKTYYIKVKNMSSSNTQPYQLTITKSNIAPTPTPTVKPTPTPIPTPKPKPKGDFIAVEGGGYHTLALNDDGTVWAWGDNTYGQLGDGTNKDCSYSPIRVLGLTDIIAISTRSDHNLALKSDGTVWAWGTNTYGELGDGNVLTTSNIPVQVTGLTDVISVSAGRNFSLALKSDGTVYSWGNNKNGQLGLGTTYAFFKTPQKINTLANVTEIHAGNSHALALCDSSFPYEVWLWGKNQYGALTDGTLTDSISPIKSSQLVFLAEAGLDSTFTSNEETIAGYGYNQNGQLGIGSLEPSITGESGKSFNMDGEELNHFWWITKISSQNTTLFIQEYAGFKYLNMAGLNSHGQFGTNSFRNFRYDTYQYINLEKLGLDSNKLTDASAGSMHTVLLLDGNIYCAGRNQKGQCGASAGESVSTFTKVKF